MVWFLDEPAVEEVIVWDRYDLGLSLLHFEDRVSAFGPAKEDPLDAIGFIEGRARR